MRSSTSRVQINPPFDASEPCPACQQDLRNVSALIHNFLTRCDVAAGRVREGKAMVKLNDLRCTAIPDHLTVPHPAAEEVLAVARALVQACDGMTDEGATIRWTPEILARVEGLIQRAAAAEDAFDAVSNAHFADARHYRGEENLLRESRGSRWAGFVHPDYKAAAYNFTVEVVEEGGDLTHTICGTQLKLHDHFKGQLALDPHFYGKVWCPTCRQNLPFAQFRLDPDVLLTAA
jgi:hypothetical protein